jgi:hypothetical protein
LITDGPGGIRIWDPEDGQSETLTERSSYPALSGDRRLLLVGEQGEKGEARLYDLEHGSFVQLDSRGPCVGGGLDAAGEIAFTAPLHGLFLQIGRVDGGPLHRIVQREKSYSHVLSPDARWLASIGLRGSTTIHLWPIPDLSKAPLHTLPHDELLAKLRTLTNLRVVKDPESSDWNWSLDPFPGWEQFPEW